MISDARGKVGEIIYSRNRGGPYIRSIGTNLHVPTAEQLICRDVLKAVTKDWSEELTEANRQSWRAYAAMYPLPDMWGARTYDSGFSYFVKCNFQPYRVNATLVFYPAPTRPPMKMPQFAFTAVHTNNRVRITLPLLSYPAPEDWLTLWWSIGLPMPPGRNSYHGPWKFLDCNTYEGNWWTYPWQKNLSKTLITGMRIWSRLVAQDGTTGAISTTYEAMAVVT